MEHSIPTYNKLLQSCSACLALKFNDKNLASLTIYFENSAVAYFLLDHCLSWYMSVMPHNVVD